MKLFVCGTPYCGTSVIGEALARAEVPLGRSLGTATTNEAVGLFVDREVLALHRDILAANSSGALAPAAAPLRVEETHRQRARDLIARQFGASAEWAVVDPQAALFTALWDEVVPDARWVFLIRRPAETAWAMHRRELLRDTEPSPRKRLARLLAGWNRYASAIVDFCRRAEDRAVLLFAPEDFGPNGVGVLAPVVGERAARSFEGVYRPGLLRTSAPAWVRLQSRLHGETASIMDALQASRDGMRRSRGVQDHPATASAGAVDGRRVVCLASRRRLAISETFIRDHIRHLPATVRWLVGENGASKRDKDELPLNTPLERSLQATLKEFGHLGTAISTRGVARYLRRERVEVVLAEFGPVAIDYIDACRVAGIPLVAHFHGYDAYRRSTLAQYSAAYRRLFAAAQVLVVVSRDMGRQLESLGAPPEKIVWSPCGVDTRAFGGADPGTAAPLFVSVGRFVEKKAPHNVLLAFRHLAERRPDARLVMIGEGIMLETCHRLSEVLGLADRVLFTGAQSPAVVASYLRSARGFVQHSMRDADGNVEGTPVSVLEAGATGLAVVATRHMGIEDVVVHGETGLLVEEGDVRGMGEHLMALYDDPALAAAMGRQGRARICSEFSMERAIGRLWEALEMAIQRAQA